MKMWLFRLRQSSNHSSWSDQTHWVKLTQDPTVGVRVGIMTSLAGMNNKDDPNTGAYTYVRGWMEPVPPGGGGVNPTEFTPGSSGSRYRGENVYFIPNPSFPQSLCHQILIGFSLYGHVEVTISVAVWEV